jgi:hypothetical protein
MDVELDATSQVCLWFIQFVVTEYEIALLHDEICESLVTFWNVSHKKRLKKNFYFNIYKFEVLQKGSNFVRCHGA